MANVNDAAELAAPAITGTVQEDQTLTADTGGWITDDDGLGSFSYQWQRSTDGGTTWNNVGADANTYALGDADVGALMRVQVTYTDAHRHGRRPAHQCRHRRGGQYQRRPEPRQHDSDPQRGPDRHRHRRHALGHRRR